MQTHKTLYSVGTLCKEINFEHVKEKCLPWIKSLPKGLVLAKWLKIAQLSTKQKKEILLAIFFDKTVQDASF